MIIRLPRLSVGVAKFDQWIDSVLSAIERAVNVTYMAPLFVIKDDVKGRVVGMQTPIGIYFAITTEDVAAGTYGSPTATSVSLLAWDGSALSDTGITQDCYFPWPTSASIGTGKLCAIVYFYGAWFILAADCT